MRSIEIVIMHDECMREEFSSPISGLIRRLVLDCENCVKRAKRVFEDEKLAVNHNSIEK